MHGLSTILLSILTVTFLVLAGFIGLHGVDTESTESGGSTWEEFSLHESRSLQLSYETDVKDVATSAFDRSGGSNSKGETSLKSSNRDIAHRIACAGTPSTPTQERLRTEDEIAQAKATESRRNDDHNSEIVEITPRGVKGVSAQGDSLRESSGSSGQQKSQSSDEASSKGSKADSQGTSRSPQIHPNMGRLVLEFTGKHLGEAHKKSHQEREKTNKLIYKHLDDIRTFSHQRNNKQLPNSVRADAEAKRNAAEAQHSKTCIKYWDLFNKMQRQGKDIEHIGMVNKHFQACMKKAFPPQNPDWAKREKRLTLEHNKIRDQERFNQKHGKRFRERLQKKHELRKVGQGKTRESPEERRKQERQQAPAKRKARGQRDKAARRFKRGDRTRFKGLSNLFRQDSS